VRGGGGRGLQGRGMGERGAQLTWCTLSIPHPGPPPSRLATRAPSPAPPPPQGRKVRSDGTDEALAELARRNALAIGAGHSFIIFMEGAYPLAVLNAIKARLPPMR
jgi:hypothetical protein